MMKLMAFFIFAACLQVSAKSYSQRLNLKLENVPIEKALQEIKRQTGVLFLYNSTELKKLRKVSLVVNDASLEETLTRLLTPAGLTYRMVDRTIILSPIPSAKQPDVAPPAQTKAPVLTTTGIVTDESGTPLSGASVKIKGTPTGSGALTHGAITDRNGHFFISGTEGTLVLIVTYIGYQPQELTVQAGTAISIHLKPAQNPLDEMVIVGYGATSRRLNTGSVSSITAGDIGKETVTNPITALQGHIAGMQITQDNGLPGGGVRVNIRGASSGLSSAGFIPLYVIDGVPFTLFNGGQPASDALNAYGVTGPNGNLSPFSLIDPADIDRIDVLKDADATAIYGSRGANGVVLITTKKGGKSKTVFSVNAYTGFEKVAHYIPMMNTAQYLQMRKEAFANAGVTPTATNAKDLMVWDPNAYTDWQKWAIGGSSPLTNVNASVSGGNQYNNFLFSSSYRHEGTVFRGPFDATTISNRLTAGHTSEDRRFNINGSVNYTSMVNNLPSYDMSQIWGLAPNYPLYNNDGTLNWTSTNPLSYLKQAYNATTTNLITSMTLSYKLLTGLTLKTDLGYSLTRLHQTQASPASSKNPAASPISSLSYADNDNGNYIVEPQIQYNRLLGGGKLDVLGGATFQQNKSTGVYLYGSGFSNEALINTLAAASSVVTYANNNSLYKYNAFFGRINYSFADKYILDLTARRDGSSRFGPGHRFGNFGAVGAAWVLSQEKFMKQLPFVSFAKLRASYGLTGNDQIPNYQYFSTYSTGTSSSAYQGSNIVYPSNIANPDLQWETRKKLDIALELGLFHDRISLKTDFYRDRSSNLLTYISTPAQIGTTAYYGNFPALIQNQGFEFELNTVNLSGKYLRWTTAFNLTLNANKLINYPGLATSSYSMTYQIGRPTDITWLYHYTGVNPTTGLPTFQDLNKDGAITTLDRAPAKYGTPYYGGITNDITFRNFDLNFTLQYYHRYGYMNSTLTTNFNPYGYTYANQSTAILNRWTGAGSTAFFPMASVVGNNGYSTLYSSDYNWGDGSFIKLKTVSLSYSFSKAFLKKIGFAGISVYAQGQNLYTWTKQKYTYDPETTQPGTGSGLGTGRYIAFPQLRTIVFGLNCSF